MTKEFEIGAKPNPINLEAPESGGELLHDMGEAIVNAVRSPDYRDMIAKAANLPAQISYNDDSDRRVMQASFDPTVAVPDYIRGTLEQLGSIQRYLHSRDIQKLERAQVMKLTRELFEYQYRDMQHLLLLGMDIQKKTRFVQYLNATKALQIRIQKESFEAQVIVVSTLIESEIEAYKAKNIRDVETRELHSEGVLDNKQFEKVRARNEKFTDELVSRLDETARLLIIRHTEFLYKTLELFKTKLIEGGML